MAYHIDYKLFSGIRFTLYCDNESLIKTINSVRFRQLTPKFHYSTDCDIIREIVFLLQHLGKLYGFIAIRHIKGHQDRSSKTLSKEAILNVEADRLATRALVMTAKPPLQFPNSTATLLIKGKNVSSKHTVHIREAHHCVKLREHYLSINSWTNEIFDDVWWLPHGTALHRLSTGEKNTLQKFFHNRLPCNRRESRYYQYIPEGCSKCGELEHQFHIIKCEDCVLRSARRKKFLIDTRMYLGNTHTNSNTTRVIIEGLTAFLEARDMLDIHEIVPEASVMLQKAYSVQEDIGWEEWYKGRISIQWRNLYEHDLQTSNHNMSHQTPERWATNLILITWRFFLDSWSIRNDIEHGLDTDPLQVKKQKLIRKIMWQKEQIQYFPTSYLATMKEEQLHNLPLENLMMTESQFTLLIRASCLKPTEVINDND